MSANGLVDLIMLVDSASHVIKKSIDNPKLSWTEYIIQFCKDHPYLILIYILVHLISYYLVMYVLAKDHVLRHKDPAVL